MPERFNVYYGKVKHLFTEEGDSEHAEKYAMSCIVLDKKNEDFAIIAERILFDNESQIREYAGNRIRTETSIKRFTLVLKEEKQVVSVNGISAWR